MREKEVGAIIKKYREKHGLTIDELAEKLNLWNRYVSLWERGLTLPDARWVYKIVDVLEIPSPDANIILRKKDLLDIKIEELIIPGLVGEYCFLHLADLHAVVIDETETKARIEYQIEHNKACFWEDGVDPLQRMEAFISYINEHKEELDGVLFTGDIIDCPFQTCIEYLKKMLGKLPIPYMYVLGNHDWMHFDSSNIEEALKNYHSIFDAFTDGNSFVHKKKFGELTLIGVDNSREYYMDYVADELEKQMSGEENVLLLQHCPFYPLTLQTDNKLWWPGSTYHFGTDEDTEMNDQHILDVITSEKSPVKAVLAGHNHFYHKDLLNDRVTQYITAASYYGGAILYKIHG